MSTQLAQLARPGAHRSTQSAAPRAQPAVPHAPAVHPCVRPRAQRLAARAPRAAAPCAQRPPAACTPCACPVCAVRPSTRSPSRLHACCAPYTPTCAPQRPCPAPCLSVAIPFCIATQFCLLQPAIRTSVLQYTSSTLQPQSHNTKYCIAIQTAL